MKMTVRQIAKEAGVSPATVSRAINGGGGIGEAARARIFAILDRNPDALHRRISKKSENIAVIMPESRLNYRNFFEKLKTFLKLFGKRWNLLLLPYDLSAEDLELSRIRNEIRGVILFGFRYPSPEAGAVIRKMPCVWINSHVTDSEPPCVLMGNEMAGRLAARYLLEKNCRSCAVLQMDSLNPGNPARYDGFRFEFFSRSKQCRAIRLDSPPLENLSLPELDILFTRAVKAGTFDGADGIFLPESYLVPGLHLALRRFRPNAPWPELICCNGAPELLAGLWPKPAIISLGEDLLAEYACRDLFRRIDGIPESDDRAMVFVSPRLLPPEPGE